MSENKDFGVYYDKYSVKYSTYLLFTIIGSFWGINKLFVKDYKGCYDRLIFSSISVLMSIIFFYCYIVIIDALALTNYFSFEGIEHLRQIVFTFFIPLFIVIICSFVTILVKDIVESKVVVSRYNHKVKKLILKKQIDKLEKLEEKDEQVYKRLFNYGSVFGVYHAYYENRVKHILLAICPTLVSLILIFNLFVDIFCGLTYVIYFIKPLEFIYTLYSVSANLSLGLLTFILFRIIPVWLAFNLIIIYTDYKKISKIELIDKF